MDKFKSTYRFLTPAIALMMFVSISLPAGLHAYGMDEFCAVNMDHQHKAAAGVQDAQCDLNKQKKASVYLSKDRQGNTNCDLSFFCACSLADTPVKTEAVPLSVKADVILPASGLDFSPELQTTATPREITIAKSNVSPPPIFLVNSSFLN